MSDALAVIARCLLYVGATLAIGQLAAEWARGALTSARPTRPLVVWYALLSAIALLFVAQFMALELTPTRADVTMLLRDTAWGRGWAMLAASGLLFAVCALGRAPWLVRASLAAAMAIAMSGLGHAAADDLPLVARAMDSVHVLGVGAWVGALALLHNEQAPTVWRRFSVLATVASAAVVFTGAGAAWRRLGASPLGVIVESDYGQLFGLKVALVAAVMVFGYAHRRAVQAGRAPSTRSVRVELTFAAIVFIATAWLTGSSPPGD